VRRRKIPGKRPPEEAWHQYWGRPMLVGNTFKGTEEDTAHEKFVI